MSQNKNSDKPNQGNSGNESQEQTNHGYDKKEIDPNTPVAGTDKKDGNQNSTVKQNQSIDQANNTPGFKRDTTTTTGKDDQTIDDQDDGNDGNHIDSRDTEHDTEATETDDDKTDTTEADDIDIAAIQQNDKSDHKDKFN